MSSNSNSLSCRKGNKGRGNHKTNYIYVYNRKRMHILQAFSRSSLLGVILLFLIFLLLAGHVHPSALISKQRGLLVIPGLGRSDRLKTVEHNIKLLEPYLSV